MNELIKIDIDPSTFGWTRVEDTYGGKRHVIYIHQEWIDCLNWVKNHKAQLEKEAKLRAENPALASQWDQYQTMLRIVMDDV